MAEPGLVPGQREEGRETRIAELGDVVMAVMDTSRHSLTFYTTTSATTGRGTYIPISATRFSKILNISFQRRRLRCEIGECFPIYVTNLTVI